MEDILNEAKELMNINNLSEPITFENFNKNIIPSKPAMKISTTSNLKSNIYKPSPTTTPVSSSGVPVRIKVNLKDEKELGKRIVTNVPRVLKGMYIYTVY